MGGNAQGDGRPICPALTTGYNLCTLYAVEFTSTNRNTSAGTVERNMALATGSDADCGQETKGWKFAVASGILGWVLDAFDFFVLVFLFDSLANHFHVVEDVWKLVYIR